MKRYIGIILLLLVSGFTSAAQSLLEKNITIEVSNQQLGNVLEILSNRGDFYFSYNSKILRKDSLVSLKIRNRPVKQVLGMLFNKTYEFVESGNYVIIRKVPIRMTMVTQESASEEKIYSIGGYVYDEQTGAVISDASVYEKSQLASALTNDTGYFRLKLKSSKASTATLYISKDLYADTSIVIRPHFNQQVTITLMPVEKAMYDVIITPGMVLRPDSLTLPTDTIGRNQILAADIKSVEKTGIAALMLSTGLKIQSINLRDFFTTRPFQISLTPGLSSHGKLSGQVVNNFSLNILGGYTAGTHGIELGGLFNIDKKDVKYFQAAGLFNVVGGPVRGVQLAGINNTVLSSTRGLQAGGINNVVDGKFGGFQVGGIYNHVSDSVKGLQAAGIANFARKTMSGVQIGGVANISNRETNGIQVAGLFNYTKRLRGLQIGLINVADTSSGFSIGLINVILKGYHKISFSSNEVVNVNVAFKTGNPKLYSILLGGVNAATGNRIFSFGYGLGSELNLTKKEILTLNPEISSQYLYLGSWDYTNILNRASLNLNVKLGKYVSFFAGPAYNVLISDQKAGITDYRFPIPSLSYKTNSFAGNVTGWLGWNVGINFF